jgi:hypothetical protein
MNPEERSVPQRPSTRPFTSLLWPEGHPTSPATPEDVLHDLALDQVLAQFEPEAAALPWTHPLPSVDAVRDRQAVFRGLATGPVRACVDGFLAEWAEVQRARDEAARSRHQVQRSLWHVRALVDYSTAVDRFAAALSSALADSAEESELLDGLAAYVEQLHLAPTFTRRRDRAVEIRSAIDELRYNALLQGGKVSVAAYDDEPDLESAVLETFDRFRQGAVTDYRVRFPESTDLDHVQAQILDLVLLLHPEPFRQLVGFAAETGDFLDEQLIRFTEEVPFFLTYLDLLRPLHAAGLPVSYPEVSPTSHHLSAPETWDLVLAASLAANGREVVTNDLALAGEERILVVSGPNQGGKTTTARIFGQLHHLASMGCPVPGRAVELPLADAVLTLFEREEQSDSLEGRLGTEIDRLHDLLDKATGRSAIVLNEVFSSTTLQDARILTRDVLERISALDAVAVCVTFIDELSHLNERTVSMTSTVDPDDPAIRTFRVERRTADGRAYVQALAAKHGLTGEQIANRLEDAR